MNVMSHLFALQSSAPKSTRVSAVNILYILLSTQEASVAAFNWLSCCWPLLCERVVFTSFYNHRTEPTVSLITVITSSGMTSENSVRNSNCGLACAFRCLKTQAVFIKNVLYQLDELNAHCLDSQGEVYVAGSPRGHSSGRIGVASGGSRGALPQSKTINVDHNILTFHLILTFFCIISMN